MKKHFIFLLIAAFCSCKNNTQKTGSQDQKKNFFPVNAFIQNEINEVDSLPIAITKYNIQDNKTDTTYIQSPEFNQMAKEFICEDLKPENFEKEFSETSFIDETTHAATFTYSTKNSKLDVQRVDVLATSGDGMNKVSSIYLEKFMHKGDTAITKKLLWRAKTSFQIVTSMQVSDKPATVKQLKLVWGTE
jgi:hypothetical protein